MVGGRPLTRRADLSGEGYTFDQATHVLQVHHTSSRDIDIQGPNPSKTAQDHIGAAPPLYVTFDDPHQPASTVLNGAYPSGVIDWPADEWQIAVPAAQFGTFNLVLNHPEAKSAEFRFAAPRIFVGFDVSNDGPADASITILADTGSESKFTIKPGELRRIRTAFSDPVTRVQFQFANAPHLRFDNLAYVHP